MLVYVNWYLLELDSVYTRRQDCDRAVFIKDSFVGAAMAFGKNYWKF